MAASLNLPSTAFTNATSFSISDTVKLTPFSAGDLRSAQGLLDAVAHGRISISDFKADLRSGALGSHKPSRSHHKGHSSHSSGKGKGASRDSFEGSKTKELGKGARSARDIPMTTGNGFTDRGFGTANSAYQQAVAAQDRAGQRGPNHLGDLFPPGFGLRELLNGYLGPVFGDAFKEYTRLNQGFNECAEQAISNSVSMNRAFRAGGVPLEAGIQYNSGHAWTVIRATDNPNGPKLYGDSWQNWPDLSNSPPATPEGTVWSPMP